jgi:hypothetical protein
MPNALLKAPPAADEVKLVALGPATASADATREGRQARESATAARALRARPARRPAGARAHGRARRRRCEGRALRGGRARRGRRAEARVLQRPTRRASSPSSRSPRRRSSTRASRRCATFALAWLDGLARSPERTPRTSRDVSPTRRRCRSAPGVGGAPEAIALLERLGQIEPATLAQQRALIGASATGPVTLDALTQKTWTLARAGGLTTSAAPSPLPIDERVALAIAPAPAPKHAAEGDTSGADAGAFAALPSGTTPLVVYRAVDAQTDAAAVAAQIGFLAGVFEHAAFRVTAKGGDKAARAIAAQARDKFDVPASRLATTAGEPAGAFASVEIVSLP